MKKILLLLSLSFCLTQIYAQTWNLVWSDEFDYTGLPDASKWDYEQGYIRNNELQYYTYKRLKNVKVENGNLHIIGRKESYKGMDYTSASITTDGKYSWAYGKIEARIKLSKGQGIWPAFWLLGQNTHQVMWPACGEIDIMEHINNENTLYGTMHWDNNGYAMYGGNTSCDVTKFHLYSIEWTETSIKWFLDGVKYWEGNISNNINSTEEFHNPFYIILNMAIGGDWPGSPDATTTFPAHMFVDYVRVYQDANSSSSIMAGLTESDNRESVVHVFPNPVKDKVTIDAGFLKSESKLLIYTMSGQVLVNQQLTASQTQIDMSAFTKGIYFVKIVNQSSTEIIKIMKE